MGLQFYPSVDGTIAQRPVIFSAQLSAVDGSCLQLLAPRWIDDLEDTGAPRKGETIDALQNFQWNLGSDVKIEQLKIEHGQVTLKGQITVNP